MKIKRMDLIFIIILGIITIISIDFILNESHRAFIENIASIPPFQDIASGLLITFLVCLIGNLLPIPTPYTFVVCFSSLPFLHINLFVPIVVALIASLGSLVGELGGYFVGRGASAFISEEQSENLKKYQKFLIEHPKAAPFMIYIFGFTPLNDDFITIPLGILKYSLFKTIFWCWLGKLSLMLVFSYNVINICSLLGGENWVLSIVSMYLITVILYLMIKIDLIELYNKFADKNLKKKENS
ncbi:MAG: VTT domain-containing protein [Promethearchaeota archaeon]